MSAKRARATVIGVGAAACAACCAGPILGILAAIGLTAAAGVAVFGIVGLTTAALAIPVIIRHRRRSTACTSVVDPVTVMLDAPSLRPTSADARSTPGRGHVTLR